MRHPQQFVEYVSSSTCALCVMMILWVMCHHTQLKCALVKIDWENYASWYHWFHKGNSATCSNFGGKWRQHPFELKYWRRLSCAWFGKIRHHDITDFTKEFQWYHDLQWSFWSWSCWSWVWEDLLDRERKRISLIVIFVDLDPRGSSNRRSRVDRDLVPQDLDRDLWSWTLGSTLILDPLIVILLDRPPPWS